jgi:integrase
MAGSRRRKYPGVQQRGSGYAGHVKIKVDGDYKTFWTGIYATQKDAFEAKGPLKQELQAQASRTGAGAPKTVGPFRDWWIAQERTNTKIQRERGTPENALKRNTITAYEEQTKEFAEHFKDRPLRAFKTPEAREWIVWPENDAADRRWQHNGIRRMFTAARQHGVIDTNPFIDLRLRGASKGRKMLDPVVKGVEKEAAVWRLADCALEAWPKGRTGEMWRTIILLLAFVGLRPGELYGLERSDFDLRRGRLHVRRQYVHGLKGDDLDPEDATKNWQPREVALPTWVVEAIRGLPTPINGPMWTTVRGSRLSGAHQHYYWNPIRTRFGNASMDLYELRHFCGWWMVNILKMPESQVALHLGHTDGGVLVRKLYGHADQRIAIDAMHAAFEQRAGNVVALRRNAARTGTSMAHADG